MNKVTVREFQRGDLFGFELEKQPERASQVSNTNSNCWEEDQGIFLPRFARIGQVDSVVTSEARIKPVRI